MLTYLFPGQGSQHKGMGGPLFDQFSELVEQADAILAYSVKTLCLEDPDNVLNQTQYTQPALYVVNALTYQAALRDGGELPDFCAGHSLGEYSALYAAGALSFADGLRLVKKRGELMSRAQPGAMAAILNAEEQALKQCLSENQLENIDIANYNSATQLVISGSREDIARAQAPIEALGAVFYPLNTSGAFHSHYMEEAKQAFYQFIKPFSFSGFRCPVIANTDARPYRQNAIAETLAGQIVSSVRWKESVEYLLQQGVDRFEEVGPGTVLSKLVARIKTDFPVETSPAPTPPSESIQQRIARWNHSFPIGTKVNVNGYDQPLETKTEAVILFGHRAAIYMKNYNGYFDLDDITPLAGT